MQYLCVIPFLISLYYVAHQRLDKAFLNVYLPCTFLIPYYYSFRLPHLPVISAGTGALIPIGIALLLRPATKWKFRRMDLWVVLFMVSFLLSELFREESPKDGMILWMTGFFEVFLGYVVGRQIIEPNLRLETIKRIVFMLVCLIPFALIEYRLGRNPWLELAGPVFGNHEVGWFVQYRAGKARIAICYGDAILAGMLFLLGIALNYYLVQIYKLDKLRLGPLMSKLQKYRIPLLGLPVLLYLTGSRGPLACALLTFLVMQIPRFRKLRTGVILVTLILVIGGGVGAFYFQKYISVPVEQATGGEAQTSAIYRRQLIENYAPVIERGGWLGYGLESRPVVGGQVSIDNNYLLVQLAQGKLGRYLFTLIGIEAVFSMMQAGARFKSRESLFLVFCLMGAFAGLFVSLTTVYLGEQTTQILFLMLGWSQSLVDTGGGAMASALPEPKFRFKSVIA